MTTFRTRLAGVAAVVAALLALGLGTAAPAAAEAGPAYPPAAGDDAVVEADDPDVVDDGAATADRSDEDTDDDADEARDEGEGATGGTTDGEDALEDPDVVAGAPATGSGAPADPGRGVGPVLVIVAAAALLGTAVVAIARRI